MKFLLNFLFDVKGRRTLKHILQKQMLNIEIRNTIVSSEKGENTRTYIKHWLQYQKLLRRNKNTKCLNINSAIFSDTNFFLRSSHSGSLRENDKTAWFLFLKKCCTIWVMLLETFLHTLYKYIYNLQTLFVFFIFYNSKPFYSLYSTKCFVHFCASTLDCHYFYFLKIFCTLFKFRQKFKVSI